MNYPIPENEEQRLETLLSLRILDTGNDEHIQKICKTIQLVYGTEMVVVSLVAKDRQWFKCHIGLDACQTDRKVAFCNYTICGKDIFEVTNAAENEIFRNNPLVIKAPYIRYYCGAPITVDGVNIGALCLIDTSPRPPLSNVMREALLGFAEIVAQEIAVRKILKDSAGLCSIALAKAC